QEEEVVSLYLKRELSIKDIMKATGVCSEQTIYRILDENRIPRRPTLSGYAKLMLTFEEDVYIAIKDKDNMSYFVNEAVRYYLNRKK
ncbi:MAG: hypothetical protein RSA98_09600, partial [Odoribacter sp.]